MMFNLQDFDGEIICIHPIRAASRTITGSSISVYRSRETVMKKLVPIVMLISAILCPGLANAAEVKLKEFSFEIDSNDPLNVIKVTSSEGTSWDTIEEGSVSVDVKVKLDTRYPGAVVDAGLMIGNCDNAECNVQPRIGYWSWNRRDYNIDEFIVFSTDKFRTNTLGLASAGNEILTGCNFLSAAGNTSEAHSFNHTVNFTFTADTTTDHGNLDPREAQAGSYDELFNQSINADTNRKDDTEFHIICEQFTPPEEPQETEGSENQLNPFEANNVKLFLATVNGANTNGSNPANNCPALKITTRVETNQRGSVDVKLWRASGGGITSEIQNLQSHFDADKNGFFAEVEKWERFNKTTPVQYRAEVLGSTFAPQTQWKDITVYCTGAGGGGLATPDSDTFPDLPTDPDRDVSGSGDLAEPQLPDPDGPKPSWAGELIIADSAGNDKTCPRAAQLFLNVERDEPGDFDYRISCSDGKLYQGTATAFNQGGVNWEAFATHDFNINRTRNISCNLQEIKPSGAPVSVANASHDFVCANPNFDPATGDLSSGPTEPPGLPTNTLVGDFSFIDNSGNKCPRDVKALINFQLNQNKNVHYSLDCQSGSYSGVAQPIAKDGQFIAPAAQTLELPNGTNGQAKLTCALKTVSPGKPKLHIAKAQSFQCINPNVEPGSNDFNTSGNNTSSGAATPEPVRTNPDKPKKKPVRVNPVKPKKDPVRTKPQTAVKVLCKAGKVKNGKCVCGVKKQLKKVGKNRFQCIAKAVRTNPKPEKKGTVRSNPTKVKPAVRTKPKAAQRAKLVCKNGKIKRGKCTCGPKRQLKKKGKSNFVCAKK